MTLTLILEQLQKSNSSTCRWICVNPTNVLEIDGWTNSKPFSRNRDPCEDASRKTPQSWRCWKTRGNECNFSKKGIAWICIPKGTLLSRLIFLYKKFSSQTLIKAPIWRIEAVMGFLINGPYRSTAIWQSTENDSHHHVPFFFFFKRAECWMLDNDRKREREKKWGKNYN